jgi:ATP-dependent Lhr-like helicase
MTLDKFGFHPVIQSWFAETFGEPSPPQAQGWPAIAQGKNTLILAPTGSGKTLAAFLWCIDDLLRNGLPSAEAKPASQPPGVHTLYISPLKALNNDIHRNLQEPLKGIRHQARALGLNPPEIHALVRTGDTPSHVRQSMLKRPPQILITTPESLYLLLTSARGREIFRPLRYLIVDEIHALSNNKRGVHLSLSLERLMPLCQNEPVRIGLSATQRPLERIAAFLGGQKFESDRPAPRSVTIVDCGQRKEMDVRVISPVETFGDLPDATVWPFVVEKLYELIRGHRTTLVFVNMRAQTERVARLLNERHQKNGEANDKIALAHHGSISREARYDIEAQLKAGTIPAVIATSSLELGIDIGSIDLVVQVESPRTVSSALQRVGRSGHLLSATSKGRLIPLYPSDLDDTVALTHSMMSGDIEETIIPENCLDVLAQQIVAEVAMREWDRGAFYRLTRQSYCYRNLTAELFDHVVEMLAGRFADSPLRALQPRITWDRVNDRLIARKGARLQANLNGGTIPDRGYYSVYLADSNVRLGEMEEEFVFESRVGNVFFLGNNEWRIDQIQQDRIVVAPVKAVKPRPPFWKGDTLYRDFATSQKIGAFRRNVGEDLSKKSTKSGLHADESTLANLSQFLERQRELTNRIPTDKQIVVEWFRDSVDEPHVILHTCFGARVNGLWAIALAAFLEKRHGAQVQHSYDDDGIIMRALDSTLPAQAGEPLPIDDMLRLNIEEIEALINEALLDTPVFSIRFRYNAARALILPRSQPGKRIPLWLQRLRAADLLQVARQYPDFPIIIETYRDCLNELFDLPSLRETIGGLHRGEIAVHVAHTPHPSPMASGLMFNFLASNLYETDRSRMPGQIAAVSSELLAQILSQDKIPTIVTQELIAEAETRWQHVAPQFHARDREDLFAIIKKLAPIADDALRTRAKSGAEVSEWLRLLGNDNRITNTTQGWIATEDANLFGAGADLNAMRERIRRLMRTRGPLSFDEIAAVLNFAGHEIEKALQDLRNENEVVRGRLVLDRDEELWCDRHNFAELYRRAVAARRQMSAPAERDLFWRFLLRWHRVTSPAKPAVLDVIKCYSGFRFPISFFEREVLRTRCGGGPNDLAEALHDFYDLIGRGEVITRVHRESEDGRLKLDFILRGEGEMFLSRSNLLEDAQALDSGPKRAFDFLKENGASFVRDIVRGCAFSAIEIRDALSDLAKSGLASCEQYGILLSVIQSETASPKVTEEENWLPGPLPSWTQRGHRQRSEIRAQVSEHVQLNDSRWFLISSFAVMGKEMSTDERTEGQARMLLSRYGILVKEWRRRENQLQQWFDLFQMLKRLEWQGEIRRGYFVAGLSGVQFALATAVDLLEKLQTEAPSSSPVMLSTIDPALPFGGVVDWNFTETKGAKVAVVRSAANHIVFVDNQPVLYSENFGNRLWRLAHIPEAALNGCINLFKSWLQLPAALRPRRKIEIAQINEAAATKCKLADAFVRNGFERDGERLVLWPSGI